jgi:oligopeptide transport system permease protein
MKAQDYKISAEKFVFRKTDGALHDKKLETKPVSYLQDALYRFSRNKASIFAAVIICLLVLFAVFGPMLTPYTVTYEDVSYAYALPKIPFFYDAGIEFWDGGKDMIQSEAFYNEYHAIEVETGRPVFIGDVEKIEEKYMGKTRLRYSFRLDTYNSVGVKFEKLTDAEYKAVQAYQDRTGIQVIMPITDPAQRPEMVQDQKNPNIWYKTKVGGGNKTEIVFDENGNFINIYKLDDGTDNYTSKVYHEGNEKLYSYGINKEGIWEVRVDCKAYYAYYHSEVLKDGISEPLHIFGADKYGKDIFARLASGARFSFILAVIVSSVNLFVGAIYGAIEGYYGGRIDIVMERFVELLSSIPFMIVITLLKYHLEVSHMIVLFISFFLTGWTGMAARTRMQFYRFKNQEYVLVARTLGANDKRIMFKHIFPNAIGTLITGSVLVIPGVIFSETSLSYLNIIDLNSSNITSVGTLLAAGQNALQTHPHIILFPAVFISLLMLSFNLFGNGLRDAFNPSLRGTED